MTNSFDINSRVTSLSYYPKDTANCPPIVYLCIVLGAQRDGRYKARNNCQTGFWRLYTSDDYTLLVQRLCFLCFVFFLMEGMTLP